MQSKVLLLILWVSYVFFIPPTLYNILFLSLSTTAELAIAHQKLANLKIKGAVEQMFY